MMCRADLMSSPQPYVIERAIRHYPQMELDNVVFEYALCAQCMSGLEKELSRESMMRMATYMRENMDPAARPQWQPEELEEDEELAPPPPPLDTERWVGTCAVKNTPAEQLTEYSMHARCLGDRIIPEVFPYMISGNAQDEIMELLSNKSLGFLDDFTDRHFSGPPELKELFKGRPVLV